MRKSKPSVGGTDKRYSLVDLLYYLLQIRYTQITFYKTCRVAKNVTSQCRIQDFFGLAGSFFDLFVYLSEIFLFFNIFDSNVSTYDVLLLINLTEKKYLIKLWFNCLIKKRNFGQRVLLDFLGSFLGCPNRYTGFKSALNTALLVSGKLYVRAAPSRTTQKMKYSFKDFFSKCDQIRSFLRIWSHLLRKSLTENFIFSAVIVVHLSISSTSHALS